MADAESLIEVADCEIDVTLVTLSVASLAVDGMELLPDRMRSLNAEADVVGSEAGTLSEKETSDDVVVSGARLITVSSVPGLIVGDVSVLDDWAISAVVEVMLALPSIDTVGLENCGNALDKVGRSWVCVDSAIEVGIAGFTDKPDVISSEVDEIDDAIWALWDEASAPSPLEIEAEALERASWLVAVSRAYNGIVLLEVMLTVLVKLSSALLEGSAEADLVAVSMSLLSEGAASLLSREAEADAEEPAS